MEEYDIGILTFWNVPNYGTFVQAYALQKVIQTMFPTRDCRQIAYLDKKHYNGYYSKLPRIRPMHKAFYCDLAMRMIPWSKYNKKKKLFLDSYDHIPHTKHFSVDSLEKCHFTCVILGSDIIWDYSFQLFNRDPFLFGNKFNSETILSYGGSFGRIEETAVLPEYVVNGLRRMKFISTREEKSAKIIEKAIGKYPDIVLDPTWLWDFQKDPNVPERKYQSYMIVYGQDFTSESIQQIREYANRKNYLLICLDCNDDNYEWCDIVLKQYQLSPMEWISLFKYAETVATTTYHGLTFALIFNKAFAFCKTPFIMAKAESFLKDIGIYELFNDESVTIESMIEWDWDYSKVNKIIEEKRRKSLNFLKYAISDERER